MDEKSCFAMNYSAPLATNGQVGYISRRPSTSSGRPSTSSGLQRPSTSSGEPIEPASTFLRDALREKKGMPPRSRSSTPKRARPAPRSQSYKDEWIHSSADERLPGSRPTRPRRMSDVSASRRGTPPTTLSQSVGARETENRIDKLEKENWDLKHRVALYQERSKLLTARLEEHEADAENLRKAEEKLSSLIEQLRLEKENNVELTQINEELVQQLELRDNEVETLEKDSVARQNAIEEAAGIIQHLEQQLAERDERIHSVQQQRSPPRHDSDYFSADAETQPSRKLPPAGLKPPATSHSADSDYFSADTSPLVTPKTIKRVSPSIESKSPPMQHARESSAAFNREVGIRSITSKDSLFSSYLESPKLPEHVSVSSRMFRLKSIRKRTQSPKLQKVPEVPSHRKSNSQAQVESRPLRNLYMTGELGVRINSNSRPVPPAAPSEKSSVPSPYSSSPESDACGGAKARSTPSVASPTSPGVLQTSPASGSIPRIQHIRSNSTNTRPNSILGFMRHNTTPARPTPRPTSSRGSSETRRNSVVAITPEKSPRSAKLLTKPRASTVSPSQLTRGSAESSYKRPIAGLTPTYATPPAQSAPTYSTTKPTTRTHRSPPTPNFSQWPRRYPAWPPSASLVNRDLLFHGEGMHEIFGNVQDAENVERHY